MNLQEAHERFGWPKPKDVTHPKGEGPSILAQGVTAKIGRNLPTVSENGGTANVRTGVLFANPGTDRTEPPLAIVCEFSRHVSEDTLLEAHRLAWNFAHSPLLITLEPSRILAWSCNVRPSHDPNATISEKLVGKLVFCEITRLRDPLATQTPSLGLEEGASRALQWINLLAGSHFQTHPKSFKSSERLDATLVANLLCVRNDLRDQLALRESRCHDLLARLIFIQFLFQRKDSEGRPALHATKLRKLADDGILRNRHETLESLLGDYEDAYAFFRWLNEHFNGDLFPGKAATPQEREREWTEEKSEVNKSHLKRLADFIGGKVDLSDGQGLLWRHYAFDTIPLELISSIYEVFVGPPEENKSYYTSSHLVDFMLDAVLPWNGKASQLRVLDPACGSGIFLVKAFQRLVHRWRREYDSAPKPTDLKNILQNQIYGVDINPEAVRVASFSLYLAMCDELDPRQYWSNDKLFPLMRDRNLKGVDFFSEKSAPFRTKDDAQTFDVIIGNAPWGKGSAGPSGEARDWARIHGWAVPGKDLGPVFLAKSASLVKPDGWVSMLQSAGILLNRTGPTQAFRRKLLSTFRLDEVINLAAVRRVIFANAIGPACIVTFQPCSPADKSQFAYVTPKPQGTAEDGLKVVIEPHDIHIVSQSEAADNDVVWSALMWGGQRDLELVRRLARRETVGSLVSEKKLATREGIIRGESKQREDAVILGRRMLSAHEFPGGAFLEILAEDLPVNTDPKVHYRESRKLDAFESPQLIFKQSWRAEKNRFQAVLVKPDKKGKGAICSDSYVSVCDLTGKHQVLAGLWLTLNSHFSPYWFALVAGQFSGFIPKATETELRQMPVIALPKADVESIARKGYAAIDNEVVIRLGLNESEKILLEELHQVVLPDAQRRKGEPPGKQSATPEHLQDYAATFLKVLRATFGKEKLFSATIFEPPSSDNIPARLIAIQLGLSRNKPVRSQPIQSDQLTALLRRCGELFFRPTEKQIGFQRVIEAIDQADTPNGKASTLYLVRPNQRRYWLRSLALRDADRLGSLINHLRDVAES
jgi:hypothetical protein